MVISKYLRIMWGEKIKVIRSKYNLSQAAFGRRIGVSGKSISAYETGKAKPSIQVLNKISEQFDASFIYIKNDYQVNLCFKIQQLRDSLLELENIITNK